MTADAVTYTYTDSPLGRILVAQNSVGLVLISFQQTPEAESPQPDWHFVETLDGEATDQLCAYFNGQLHEFDLPLAPQGTAFQQAVWQALQSIAYGQTWSYAELAQQVGRPKAVRAVGAANGRNPLPIVIPCHRVIGSNGTLTGYRGGLPLKQALLSLERQHRPTLSSQLAISFA